MIQLPLLVVFSLVTGMFGSYFARKISGYKDYEINLQHYMASFLSSLLYAFLIWIGFITDILTWFDIQTGDGIVRLCIVFLILKIAVSYYCDEMADQITFKYKK